jgi:pyruvate dehydrogenase E1 component beta subunit/2-oxoisovalerate dehydrogenase E1 component
MTSETAQHGLSRADVRDLLRQMMRVREFEAACSRLYAEGRIRECLRDGEAGVAVGVIGRLEREDRLVAAYRQHAHALVRGVPMAAVMAEMYGEREGCSGGRGGPTRLFDRGVNFYSGGLPLAAGLSLADHMRGDRRVTACFFTNGAVCEGEVHETLGLAALWRLPVLFVSETNDGELGISQAETDIRFKAESHGVAFDAVDGLNVVAVEAAARRGVEAVRGTGRPYLLHCDTRYLGAHSRFDAQLNSYEAAKEALRPRSPIVQLIDRAVAEGLLAPDDVPAIEAEAKLEAQAVIAYAESGSSGPLEEEKQFVYAANRPAAPAAPRAESVHTTYGEAVGEAIREALRGDERVLLMSEEWHGESCAPAGDLLAEFGAERIRANPFSASGLAGAGLGAAMAGLRPIMHLTTGHSGLLALDQILTMAEIRYVSSNQFCAPVVIRMATGIGSSSSDQHSPCLVGWLPDIPGLRVLAPATLEDARGMLWTALLDPDPVVIFEDVTLRDRHGSLAADAGPVDIDRAAVRRSGSHISLITYGGALWTTLEAAERLAKDGIEAEVIDLRVLRPIDEKAIMDSVAKTRRALIVDEGWGSGGMAAEIGMRISEQVFSKLKVPIGRVCRGASPLSYSRHLQAALPQADEIVAAAKLACHSSTGD